MSISQDRLLKLLEAGEQFQMLHQALIGQIIHAATYIKTGQQTAAEAFADLAMMASVDGTKGPSLVLSEERVRYRLTAAKNTTERLRKQRNASESPQRQLRHFTEPRTAMQVAEALAREESEDQSDDPMIQDPDLSRPPDMTELEWARMQKDIEDGLAGLIQD
jgi:hypothetical protein